MWNVNIFITSLKHHSGKHCAEYTWNFLRSCALFVVCTYVHVCLSFVYNNMRLVCQLGVDIFNRRRCEGNERNVHIRPTCYCFWKLFPLCSCLLVEKNRALAPPKRGHGTCCRIWPISSASVRFGDIFSEIQQTGNNVVSERSKQPPTSSLYLQNDFQLKVRNKHCSNQLCLLSSFFSQNYSRKWLHVRGLQTVSARSL